MIEERHREATDHALDRLEALVKHLHPELVLDEPLPQFDAWMFVHVSAAFALSLERLDGAQTEQFWAVIEEAWRVLRWPSTQIPLDWYVETGFFLDLETSSRLVEAMLWARLFHKHSLYGSYEDSLECLFKASTLCFEADSELYGGLGNECWRIDDWMMWDSARKRGEHMEWLSPIGEVMTDMGPGTRVAGTGFHLLASFVSAQEAVDTFEKLVAARPDKTDWHRIAELCLAIQEIWAEPTPNPKVGSNYWRFEETARDYWVMARGLALQKMSPDALVRFLREEEKSQGEKRLRGYFFGVLWNALPEQAKGHLINADRLYYGHDGARQSVFNELRLACEAVIEVVLWRPYHEWLQNKALKDFRSLAVARDERRYGTFLSQMLEQLWGALEFREFLAEKYAVERQWILAELKNELQYLLKLRNPAEHPQRGSRSLPSRQIQETYQKFLGIGQAGIICRLLKLKPVSTGRQG